LFICVKLFLILKSPFQKFFFKLLSLFPLFLSFQFTSTISFHQKAFLMLMNL